MLFFCFQVFTAASHLAEIYEKLQHTGCVLFTAWKAMLYCGEKNYSIHISFDAPDVGLLTGNLPLLKELQVLTDFMNICLEEWHEFVDEKRSQCYQLNYYTTEQLVYLRHVLAEFLNLRTNLPAQSLDLLSAVKSGCTQADVHRAIATAAKDTPQPLDEAAAEEQAEMANLETGKKIVKQLMEDCPLSERCCWAAVQELGYDMEITDYMEWGMANDQDEGHITSLTSNLDFLNDRDTAASDGDNSDEEDMSVSSFATLGQTSQQVRSDIISSIAERLVCSSSLS